MANRSRCLGGQSSPMPVSTSATWPAPRTSRQRALMRELAEALGLPELAREAAAGAGANAGLLSSPELSGILLHELTRVLPGFALSFGASLGLCGQSLLRRGTPAQRERWAAPVLGFARLGCWALTEPEAGSDAFALRTTARRAEGGFSL